MNQTSDDWRPSMLVWHEPPGGSVIALGRACLTAFDSSWVTVIALTGDIDASNAAEVGTCLHGFVSRERALVLDLSNLDFLGVEGAESLFKLADTCDRLEVGWALVASQSVRRLLRVGDREGRLPAVGSMVEVLQLFRTTRRRRIQLQVVD